MFSLLDLKSGSTQDAFICQLAILHLKIVLVVDTETHYFEGVLLVPSL